MSFSLVCVLACVTAVPIARGASSQIEPITYTPSINIMGATFVDNNWSAFARTPLSFTDAGDTGLPAVAVSWNFGDGTIDTTHTSLQTVTHTYSPSAPKTYTVTLALTGTAGVPTVAATIQIFPEGPPPACSLSITGPTTIPAGTPGVWTASVFAPSQATTLTWITSESAPVTAGTGSSLPWTFQGVGSQWIKVAAKSASCSLSRSLTVTVSAPVSIIVDGASQTNVVGLYDATEYAILTFSLGGTNPGGATDWTFGDGASISAPSTEDVTHTYSKSGTFAVTATVQSVPTTIRLSIGPAKPPPPVPCSTQSRRGCVQPMLAPEFHGMAPVVGR